MRACTRASCGTPSTLRASSGSTRERFWSRSAGAHGGGGGRFALEELFVTVRAQVHHPGVGDLDQRAIMALQCAPNVNEEDAVGPQRAEVRPTWLYAALQARARDLTADDGKVDAHVAGNRADDLWWRKLQS